MRWLFPGPVPPPGEKVSDRMLVGAIAYVPAIWLYEVVAVVTKAQRNGGVWQADADRFIYDLRSLEVVVDNQGAGHVFSQACRLAAEHRLSRYDAAYLELEIRKGLPLATLDEELRRAEVSTGVTLVG